MLKDLRPIKLPASARLKGEKQRVRSRDCLEVKTAAARCRGFFLPKSRAEVAPFPFRAFSRRLLLCAYFNPARLARMRLPKSPARERGALRVVPLSHLLTPQRSGRGLSTGWPPLRLPPSLYLDRERLRGQHPVYRSGRSCL